MKYWMKYYLVCVVTFATLASYDVAGYVAGGEYGPERIFLLAVSVFLTALFSVFYILARLSEITREATEQLGAKLAKTIARVTAISTEQWKGKWEHRTVDTTIADLPNLLEEMEQDGWQLALNSPTNGPKLSVVLKRPKS